MGLPQQLSQFVADLFESLRLDTAIFTTRDSGLRDIGLPVLGYDVDASSKKLAINEEEAVAVRGMGGRMLEFLCSSSSEPPRADAAEAQHAPAPVAVDEPGAAKGTPAPAREDAATIYAAMCREITSRGKEARFTRPEPSKFGAAKK
jgi:hypothetical protein